MKYLVNSTLRSTRAPNRNYQSEIKERSEGFPNEHLSDRHKHTAIASLRHHYTCREQCLADKLTPLRTAYAPVVELSPIYCYNINFIHLSTFYKSLIDFLFVIVVTVVYCCSGKYAHSKGM